MLSIGDRMELTRPSPNRPSCSAFRARQIALGVGSRVIFCVPSFMIYMSVHSALGEEPDDTATFPVRSLCGSAIGTRLCNFDWKIRFNEYLPFTKCFLSHEGVFLA